MGLDHWSLELVCPKGSIAAGSETHYSARAACLTKGLLAAHVCVVVVEKQFFHSILLIVV